MKVLRDTSETKYVASAINVEANTTGNLTNVTVINQGTKETERIGDKIWPDSMTMKFCLENNNVTTQTACVRLMIVRSRLAKTALVVGDFPGLLARTDYNTMFVLYDKFLVVGGTSSAGPQTISRKIFIKKKRFLRMEYLAANNTIALNGIYIYIVSDAAPASVIAPDITALTTLAFKDI